MYGAPVSVGEALIFMRRSLGRVGDIYIYIYLYLYLLYRCTRKCRRILDFYAAVPWPGRAPEFESAPRPEQ